MQVTKKRAVFCSLTLLSLNLKYEIVFEENFVDDLHVGNEEYQADWNKKIDDEMIMLTCWEMIGMIWLYYVFLSYK